MSRTRPARVLRSNRLLGAISVVLLLAACGGSRLSPPAALAPAPASPPAGLTDEQAATLASLQQVDDYPLYTMRYYGTLPSATSALPPAGRTAGWACSLFAALGDPSNRLYGRNFDWRFSPALLLFTEPPDGFASVSMVDLEYFGATDRTSGRVLVDPLQLPLAERRSLLDTPSMPFDGMNAAGVAVAMAALDQADQRHDPGKATIGSIAVIREILDHASTADQAVAILQQYNIDFEGGPPLHYLVADRSGAAALVEFTGGEIVVLPAQSGWHAATNFVRSAAPANAAGRCPRYDAIVKRLGPTGGILEARDARGLLGSVSQASGSPTQWSLVYNLSQGQVEVVVGRQYDRVHTFHLAMLPAR